MKDFFLVCGGGTFLSNGRIEIQAEIKVISSPESKSCIMFQENGRKIPSVNFPENTNKKFMMICYAMQSVLVQLGVPIKRRYRNRFEWLYRHKHR